MKKSNYGYLVILFSIIFITSKTNAQVNGISYTLSPTTEYQWFDENSGLSDGFTIGGQLGFGFGQNVELNAIYLQGIDMRTDYNRLGINAPAPGIEGKNVDFRRYGGEIKLNLSRTALKPYISLGTGIQDIGLEDGEQYSQIYTTGGLGIKLTAADRYTLAIQGNTNYYNFKTQETLLTEAERAENGIDLNDVESELLNNYSLRASLMFYIGGRDPESLTDIDQAYWDNFSNGFSGLSVPIEPSIMKVNFHEDLPYRDAYFAGGSIGFDFGPLVGVRGFYYQALEEGEYNKFDKLAMYGGEAKFKLNEGKGFVPSIIIGGGNIDARDSYLASDSLSTNVGNKAFASGGLGMDIPFSKYFKASIFAKALLTSGQRQVEDLVQPNDIMTSWAYGASLNFILGKSTDKVDVVKQSTFDSYTDSQEAEYEQTLAKMRNDYSNKVDSLEKSLDKAVDANNAQEVDRITKEKESAERVKDRLDEDALEAMKKRMTQLENEVHDNSSKRENENRNYKGNNDRRKSQFQDRYYRDVNGRDAESVIKMTPSEFQLIMRDLLDARKEEIEMRNEMRKEIHNSNKDDQSSVEELKEDLKSEEAFDDVRSGMEDMQSTISDLKAKMLVVQKENEDLKREQQEAIAAQEREKEIQMLVDEIEKNREQMDEMKRSQSMKLDEIDDDQTREAVQQYTKAMETQLNTANERIMELSRELSTVRQNQTTIANTNGGLTPTQAMGVDDDPISISNTSRVQTRDYDETETGVFSKFRYEGMSGFAGFSLGGSATFNLGYRLHYGIVDNENIEFMPETFFGLGSPSSFGISANGLYKLNLSENINPYIGAGLGLLKVGEDDNEDKIKGGINFIFGTTLSVADGDLYVDYTARNLFKYNQFIVGYRFPF